MSYAWFSNINRFEPYWNGSQKRAVFPNASCLSPSQDNSVPFKAHIEPSLRLLTKGMMSVTRPPYNDDVRYANKYYGNFITADQVLQPLSVSVSERKKPRSRHKDFARRRKAGEIVTNPMYAYQGSATMYPGCLKDTATIVANQFYIGHELFMNETFPLVPTGCSTPGLNRLRDYGEYLHGTVPLGGRIIYDGVSTLDYGYPLTQNELRDVVDVIAHASMTIQDEVGLTAQALCKANSGIIDLSTSIAEFPETLKSILSAVVHILNKYLETKRAVTTLYVRKGLKRHEMNVRLSNMSEGDPTSDIASLWLNFRYNIMPNVYLIEDLIKYLGMKPKTFATVREGAWTKVDSFEVNGWTVPDIEQQLRVWIKDRIAVNTAKADYLSIDALGTAWELLPLSFVVDWVINVGDYIGSFGAAVGSEQRAASLSSKVKSTMSLSNPEWVGPPITVEIESYKVNPLERRHGVLTFEVDINLMRQLDALSLSWVLFFKDFTNKLRS